MNYYNEWDKHAAQWLRNLIAAKLIPAGDVDERDIRKVKPEELEGYTQCHFFAGIGGWPLALAMAGWPDDKALWTGSCPCQPFSVAGKRKGQSDERHLWPDFLRLIGAGCPPVCFGEQVSSDDGLEWLAGVRADLAACGYAVGAADLCAACVGAPHRRQRLYWVADSNGGKSGNGELQRGRQHGQRPEDGRFACGMADASRTNRRIGECGAEEGAGPTGIGRGRSCERRAPLRMGEPSRTRLEGHAGDGDRRHESRRIEEDTAGPASASSSPSGLADTDHRSGRPHEQGREPKRRTADGGAGPWSDSRIILCGDGKRRRIPLEPALFPLAPRIPGRLGLLRGAGNSIVPQVAAEFVRAYMETRGMVS